ncbi:hypothetical protein [Streptomyces avermitilis]|uniref:hypothetical protein n=1 Tax=Streptomyces avermitilis TaxID=33903 RepID=UPI003F5421D9
MGEDHLTKGRGAYGSRATISGAARVRFGEATAWETADRLSPRSAAAVPKPPASTTATNARNCGGFSATCELHPERYGYNGSTQFDPYRRAPRPAEAVG